MSKLVENGPHDGIVKEVGRCSICGENYDHYGHNAEPVNSGRCCDYCNTTVVIPRRIGDLAK